MKTRTYTELDKDTNPYIPTKLKILRIEFIYPYYYYIIAIDDKEYFKMFLKSVTKDRDILDTGWQGVAVTRGFTIWELTMSTDNETRAKIPSELAHWFGGWSTVKRD